MATTLTFTSPGVSTGGIGPARGLGIREKLNFAAQSNLAFALAQVRQAYAGPLAEALNETTGAYANVFPDAKGIFSLESPATITAQGAGPHSVGVTVSLANFMGGPYSLRMRRWYDQSAAPTDLIQTSLTAQPFLAIAGVLVSPSSFNPVAQFDGVASCMDLSKSLNGARTMFIAGRAPTMGGNNGIYIMIDHRQNGQSSGDNAAYRVFTTFQTFGAKMGNPIPAPADGTFPNLTGKNFAAGFVWNDPASKMALVPGEWENCGTVGPRTATMMALGRDFTNTFYYDQAPSCIVSFAGVPSDLDSLYEEFWSAYGTNPAVA